MAYTLKLPEETTNRYVEATAYYQYVCFLCGRRLAPKTTRFASVEIHPDIEGFIFLERDHANLDSVVNIGPECRKHLPDEYVYDTHPGFY